MNKFYLLFILLCGSFLGSFAQGTESFENMPASSGSYTVRTWTGDGGRTWNAGNARTDGPGASSTVTGMTMRFIIMRNTGGILSSTNIPNGIGTVTFKYAKAFTSGTGIPTFGLFIDNAQIGSTITASSNAAQTASFTVNLAGTHNLEIRQLTANDNGRLALDDISWDAFSGGPDMIPPTISSTIPADNATGVSINTSLQVNFSEPVVKGTGNIVIKRTSDNSTVQTIDVTSGSVTVSTNTATVTISPLINSTDYYVEIDAGTFTDAALNAFAGITGNSTWNFTTEAPPAPGILNNNYSFTNCTTTFSSEGWRQYSVTGNEIWGCNTIGRTDAFGLQMNGFTTTAQTNEDWLISPRFDLTGVNLPYLRFYSFNTFVGNTLQLKVSTNYVSGTNPNTATWTNLPGAFPAANTSVWTLSDNISLAAYGTSNVYIAWVYTSTNVEAARWRLDDIAVLESLPACTEPTAQPTGLTLTPTPTTISGSFTASVPPADEYLVVRSTSASLGASPADGTTYTAGAAIGTGTVVSVGTSTSFVDNGLAPTTQYYYFVFADNNEDCSGGPNYLTTINAGANAADAATLSLPPCITPANPPTALNLVPGGTSISGSFTAAAGANRYLVVRSSASTLSATPVDGTVYTAGAAFGGGTVVSYTTGTSFVSTGLTANTLYYFFVFAANGECTGEPFYNTVSLDGSATTTNVTGPPPGYYTAADGLTCQPLKTALKNIISSDTQVFSYTPGLWNAYALTDMRRNDENTADIIWDMYSDNPTGPEPYTFTYGYVAAGGEQCGTYSVEGDCYNREHSTPQSFFDELAPMVSDIHHIFPTDGKVNGVRSNFPYGEVSSVSYLSQNGSKLGTGSNFGYGGTVFEPINEYKGDFARACLYMATRYEDEIIAQNWSSKGTANALFLSTTDESNAPKRRLQIYDTWFLKMMVKWHNLDPVSQKEIDRNNVIFYQDVQDGATLKRQGNRNPFVDHPEYVNMIWQCTGVLAINLNTFTAQKQDASVLLKWSASNESGFRGFEIERSLDGVTFTKTGEVAGSNSSSYNFTDVNLPNVNRVFYRLKLVNTNGTFNYSRIIPVQLDHKFSNALVYPNPTKGNLTVKLDKPLQQPSLVQVTDISGRFVFSQTAKGGAQLIELDLLKLAPGRYFIRIGNYAEMINQSFVIIK